jgi:hypothetical protein
MKNSIMVAAVLAFASLGTYAYGATTATSAMTIQAEILSSYAINCLTTTGGTANVDFALATPTASQTIGVTQQTILSALTSCSLQRQTWPPLAQPLSPSC